MTRAEWADDRRRELRARGMDDYFAERVVAGEAGDERNEPTDDAKAGVRAILRGLEAGAGGE
jgi:hypothetical protein